MAEQRPLNFESRLEGQAARSAERLAHLEDLKREAEQAIIAAESIGLSDPAAGPAFRHGETLSIACPDMEIQMRAFESSGWFYERRGMFPTASQKYRAALQNALCLSVVSDTGVEAVYRLRYKLLKVQNHLNKWFKNLDEVVEKARPHSDTYRAGSKAWYGFIDEAKQWPDRLAARGLGSENDFRKRLDAAKLDASDNEDDD